jgi:phage-related protein
MVELAVRIDKLIKSIKKIWENFKSAFNCFKIIIEEIIKIIGYSTSLWDAILSVFGKVIDFVITFTLPVVKWI